MGIIMPCDKEAEDQSENSKKASGVKIMVVLILKNSSVCVPFLYRYIVSTGVRLMVISLSLGVKTGTIVRSLSKVKTYGLAKPPEIKLNFLPND